MEMCHDCHLPKVRVKQECPDGPPQIKMEVDSTRSTSHICQQSSSGELHTHQSSGGASATHKVSSNLTSSTLQAVSAVDPSQPQTDMLISGISLATSGGGIPPQSANSAAEQAEIEMQTELERATSRLVAPGSRYNPVDLDASLPDIMITDESPPTTADSMTPEDYAIQKVIAIQRAQSAAISPHKDGHVDPLSSYANTGLTEDEIQAINRVISQQRCDDEESIGSYCSITSPQKSPASPPCGLAGPVEQVVTQEPSQAVSASAVDEPILIDDDDNVMLGNDAVKSAADDNGDVMLGNDAVKSAVDDNGDVMLGNDAVKSAADDNGYVMLGNDAVQSTADDDDDAMPYNDEDDVDEDASGSVTNKALACKAEVVADSEDASKALTQEEIQQMFSCESRAAVERESRRQKMNRRKCKSHGKRPQEDEIDSRSVTSDARSMENDFRRSVLSDSGSVASENADGDDEEEEKEEEDGPARRTRSRGTPREVVEKLATPPSKCVRPPPKKRLKLPVGSRPLSVDINLPKIPVLVSKPRSETHSVKLQSQTKLKPSSEPRSETTSTKILQSQTKLKPSSRTKSETTVTKTLQPETKLRQSPGTRFETTLSKTSQPEIKSEPSSGTRFETTLTRTLPSETKFKPSPEPRFETTLTKTLQPVSNLKPSPEPRFETSSTKTLQPESKPKQVLEKTRQGPVKVSKVTPTWHGSSVPATQIDAVVTAPAHSTSIAPHPATIAPAGTAMPSTIIPLLRNLSIVPTDVLVEELVRRGDMHKCVCGLSFDSNAMYYLHRSCHHSVDPRRCNFCNRAFSTWMEFHSHFFEFHHPAALLEKS